MKQIIQNLLSKLFPFNDTAGKPSVFIQDTWLEKTMRPTQLKDYLWHYK